MDDTKVRKKIKDRGKGNVREEGKRRRKNG